MTGCDHGPGEGGRYTRADTVEEKGQLQGTCQREKKPPCVLSYVGTVEDVEGPWMFHAWETGQSPFLFLSTVLGSSPSL